MKPRTVTEHVFRIPLGIVSVFLIALPDSLTLVDSGPRRSWPRIAQAIQGLGRRPEELTDIVITHLHADHTGGLAEAKRATGARVWMHATDAALLEQGRASRPWRGAPGSLLGALAARVIGARPTLVEPVRVDRAVVDRQDLPVAVVASRSLVAPAGPVASAARQVAAAPPGESGGLLALWTPGHTAGHLAYLWPGDGGVLFVGDAAARVGWPRVSPLYEDYSRGLESLRLLASLEFETACFSHGRPLVGGAAREFARLWGCSGTNHSA